MVERNVFILSAGRRVELIQCFKRAAKKVNVFARMIAGDCSNTAPAIFFADHSYQLPRIHEPDYIEAIIDICKKENIALLVPTIDTDLIILAENKRRIEKQTNAKVLISDQHVVRICRDKVLTQKFLEDHGFQMPKMYRDEELENGEIRFPLFIKPKSGSSSVHAFKVNNFNELHTYKTVIDEPIIQDFIEGEEYTVDVFLDFDSQIISIVPRLRLAVRSGEISKGKIVKDPNIISSVFRLMQVLKPIGHITVQLMKTKNGIEYIEINPRFGGGAPMSIMSGADSCEYLFRLLKGEKLTYNDNYRANLTYLRFDNCICLDENMNVVDTDQTDYTANRLEILP